MEKRLMPHQTRVVAEKVELDAKRADLLKFIQGEFFKTIDPSEQARLTEQWEVMTHYSVILGDRIAAF